MHLTANSTFYRLSRPALNLISLLFKTIAFANLKIKALRQKQFPDLFIISVDSLSFGGTGKTPLVMAIGKELEKRGAAFAIISRGYRSQFEKKGTRVEIQHTVEEVGDEPWLLKRFFPSQDVFVGRDRLRSIAAAAARKKRILILDDGFQSNQIKKDFSIMLLNPDHPYFYLRNFKCLARRENLVLVYRQKERAKETSQVGSYSFAIENFYNFQGQAVEIGTDKVIAFSALGDNGRFQNDMRHYHLAAFRGFSDHHAFIPADIQTLENLRRKKEADWIICSEKDFIKIKKFLCAASPLLYARNRIELHSDAIERIIKHAAEKGIL